MVKQKITPPNKQTRQTHLSRLYFLAKGCKQVPLDLTGGKVLWANPEEGYFMSAYGCKIKPAHSPFCRRRSVKAQTIVHYHIDHVDTINLGDNVENKFS